MPLRVGTDLVSVATVRTAVETHGRRYLERLYTERELQYCKGSDGTVIERLAARFAAKEATLKVLRPSDHGIPWRSIEVCRDPSGWVELELSGAAAALAEEQGVLELSLSITHEGEWAAATVIALCALEIARTDR